MDHRLIEGLMDAVAPYIQKLEQQCKEMRARLDLLETKAPEKGAAGEPGKDGRDGVDGKDAEPVDMDAVKAFLSDEVTKALACLEKPKDGTSVTLEDVIPEIRKAVAEEYSANPPAAGKDGSDGKDVDVEEVVQKAVALLPVPKDGRDGIDGKDGKDGSDGKDGEGIKELLTDADGVLVVTMTNGEIKRVGRVVGRDGKDGAPGVDGRDGADGLGFDDMTAELAEDGRTVEIRMVKGENVKVIPIKFEVPLEAGIWKDGHRYSKGDGVTFGGSFWFAQKNDPQGRPGDNGNTDWRLGVKKGRDGKDAKLPPGPIGPVSVPAAKS